MSLIFRSVKKISKKKRKNSNKTKSKKYSKDPFEDNPMKFIVEEEENVSDFPSLNAVYKTDLYGTPLPFRSVTGYDCMKFLKIKTKLQSVAFMGEYMNKSFEELRWEDYQCNRKGCRIFEEKGYLKCLSKEPMKWKTKLSSKQYEAEPLPGVSNLKLHAQTRPSLMDANANKTEKLLPQKIILQRPNRELERSTVKSKERSILTNVNKFCGIKETEIPRPSDIFHNDNTIRSSSDINLRCKKEDMVKDNLQRYFSSNCFHAAVPYEFYSQNNNYFLPCSNLNLTYNNKHSGSNSKVQTGYIWDLIKTDQFGHNSAFDRPDSVVKKDKLLGRRAKTWENISVPRVEKYTAGNKFSTDYFWRQFSPYSKDGKMEALRCCHVGRERFTKSKKYWLGVHVST